MRPQSSPEAMAVAGRRSIAPQAEEPEVEEEEALVEEDEA